MGLTRPQFKIITLFALLTLGLRESLVTSGDV